MEQTTLFINLLIDGIGTGCLYALAGIGFSLLWWLADIVHLAHGGVIIVAGYAGYLVLTSLGAPLWAALLVSIAVAVALGVLIDRLAYRPLMRRGSGEMGMLTASLGLLICLEYLVTAAFGPEGVQADAGSARTPFFPATGVLLDPYTLLVTAGTALVFVGLSLLMRFTQLGKNMRAVAENPSLAHALGIKTLQVTTAASAIAAAAGAPAALVYLHSRGVTPHDAIHIVLMGAIVAIFGGRGSIAGALVAALVIGIAESVMVWFFDAGWREVMTFGLLYVLLLVRPQGLLGTASR
jgi:branched-chain amino acid transport system permease protein